MSQFIFKDWSFNAGELKLEYSIDNRFEFCERYTFYGNFSQYDNAVLNRAINNLFFMAGVSYYKSYVPDEIAIKKGQLDAKQAAFFSKTYAKGLGEFYYVNQLDPNKTIEFPVTQNTLDQVHHNGDGLLVGLGGGKDSLVSVEMLRSNFDLTTWTLGHQAQLQPLVDTIDLPHTQIDRVMDPQLRTLPNAYNGHVPISAIFACIGTVAAVLYGKRDIVVSNERSADEANVMYRGAAINHQYSKSSEFEKDYQELLQHDFGDTVRYYSALRPLSELRISELFATHSFEKYKHVFSSCNRCYIQGEQSIFWCGACPKCAVIFLYLTPFIARSDLENLFGKNILLDEALEPIYNELLGIHGIKPLECVGEIAEIRYAMWLAQMQYPSLNRYEFDLDPNFDYKSLVQHTMPQQIFELLPAQNE